MANILLSHANIPLSHSSGRYSTRQRQRRGGDGRDEEIDAWHRHHDDDAAWQAHWRAISNEQHAAWQAHWRAISNEQHLQRREAELQPLEEAARDP